MKTGDLQRQIGSAVRAERKRQGISQEAFADSIRMHRTAFGAFERGEKDFQLSTLRRAAAGLRVRVSMLIESAETAMDSGERPQS